jgi:flagellar biosynthetic protein FliR
MASVVTFAGATSWLAAAALLSIRLGALLLATPPFGSTAMPRTVRVLFVFGLAAWLASSLPAGVPPGLLEPGPLLVAALTEFALGAFMALGIGLAFSAFTQAGRLIDVQVGFGMGQVFDPMTRQQLPALSGWFNQLALVAFFTADAHVALLRGVALSVERFPPGSAWPLAAGLAPLVSQVAALFALGFAIVAPVVACLLLADLGLAVLSRSLPQMNTFMLGIPLKVLVALVALSAWVLGAAGAVSRIHAAMFAGWEAVFR